MLSGRDTLSSIDDALREVREDLRRSDERIKTAGDALVATRKQQAGQVEALARVRADLIASGNLPPDFDAADRQASEVLALRSGEIGELRDDLDKSERAQRGAEERRTEAAERADQAATTVDRAEADIQEQLGEQERYKRQLSSAREAESVAAEAEDKARESQEDREKKGLPYENDPLFMYLWKRNYGTADYGPKGLVRVLDGQVARVCRYHDARPNYEMLCEIPRRLREHADTLKEIAAVEFAGLEQLEEQALEQGGIGPLRAKVDEANAEIAEIDRNIEAEVGRFHVLSKKLESYAAGEDRHFRKATAILAAGFMRDDVRRLRVRAERTSTGDDDVIVERIAALDDELATFKEELEHYKQSHARNRQRLDELEGVRREFKTKRYDDLHSVFNDGDTVQRIMHDFLRGIATSRDVWRTINSNQRFQKRRSNPRFGSGGFPTGGGVWGSTRKQRSYPTRGGWGGGWGGFGGFGGGGGGGFRTGGGF